MSKVSTSALVLVMVLLVAGMTAAATSVRTVSRIWLRHWAERQIMGEVDQAAPALRRPHDFLLAAGTGIASVAFTLGAVVALREEQGGLMRQLLLAAGALLLVGQVLPRAIARRWATRLVPVLAPLLRVLDALFGPILSFAARMVRPWLRLPTSVQPPAPTDPLEDLLREAEAEGIGDPAEAEIISDVVEFGEKRVRDVMTPRARMTAVSRAMPPRAVAEAVAYSHYTRIPVFGDSDRDLLGIVHAFDVIEHPESPLATMRGTSVATEDEGCGVVMRRMLRDQRHMAVVRGADGAVTGVVTLEDLVEELVGDIDDEHDEPGAPT